MLSLLQAILLGILQGITEWLPISSSGHLVIAQHLFGIRPPILFDVLLHCGTLAALVFFLRKDIGRLIKTTMTLDFMNDRMPLYIIVGSIPTALVGYFLHDLLVSLFTIKSVGFALLFSGFVLFFAKERGKGNPDFFNAVCMGVAQGVSIIPGISRSGMTISSALALGMEKGEAMRFSFLLSIPAVMGALLLEAQKSSLYNVPLLPVLSGMIASASVGYLSLKILSGVIGRGKFHYFSFYCFASGAFALIVSMM